MSNIKSRSYFIVDDDVDINAAVTALLKDAGHEVASCASSIEAMDRIVNTRPDIVILDIMMPHMDGFQLCKHIKSDPQLKGTQVVMLSAKTYEYDRAFAHKMGADGYIVKPINPLTFVEELESFVSGDLSLTYWGVRGTLPRPGGDSLRYGGNTSCITIEIPNKPLLIFDAGSGIKRLSDHVMASGKKRLTAKVFISHPHWDHINAIPFFVPMYIPGNELEVLGARHGDLTTREVVGAQMDDIYFPITMREFGARVYFRDMGEEVVNIEGITVRTMLLNHPGNCLGFRIEWSDKSVCYITDNEMFLPDDPRHNPEYVKQLADFCRDADLLITDTTYTDEEYLSKVTWGHSCVSQVANLAHLANVKLLHLFHHDPDQNDDAIDAKLTQARAALNRLKSDTRCEAPAEGSSIKL